MADSLVYQAMGKVEKSDQAKSELLQLPVTLVGYAPLAVFAYRGEIEAGLDWLEQNAAEIHYPSLAEAKVMPIVAPLREDPRYDAVMRKLGLSKERLLLLSMQKRASRFSFCSYSN